MLVGITAITLLSGCGNDTKQDSPKDAEKVVEGSAKDIMEKSRKGYEEKKVAESKREKVEVERFDTCNSQGKYCERGMLHIGSFNALKVGMSPQEVAKKLNRNAESATKTTMKGVEVTEYTYNASKTVVTVAYKDGTLYSASHIGSNNEIHTIDATKQQDEATSKDDTAAPAEEKEGAH